MYLSLTWPLKQGTRVNIFVLLKKIPNLTAKVWCEKKVLTCCIIFFIYNILL